MKINNAVKQKVSFIDELCKKVFPTYNIKINLFDDNTYEIKGSYFNDKNKITITYTFDTSGKLSRTITKALGGIDEEEVLSKEELDTGLNTKGEAKELLRLLRDNGYETK